MSLPRKPKPAAIPPRTLRTTHSRSSLSSSSSSRAATIIGCVNTVAFGCSAEAAGLVVVAIEFVSEPVSWMSDGPRFTPSGRHKDRQKRRNSLVREE